LGCFSGELLFGQRRQLVAERFRRGHHEATELVHRSRTRPHSAATLDQQKPQLLPLATAARDTQPLTGDDPACRQGGIDQVILARPSERRVNPARSANSMVTIRRSRRSEAAPPSGAAHSEQNFARPGFG